jgi:two-component system cell cycle sensor histidine kinase/response regulator CckA
LKAASKAKKPRRKSPARSKVKPADAKEHQLRQSMFTLEHASDAVVWTGRDGKFTYVNAVACRMLGYSRKEFLKMGVYDIDPGFSKKSWPKRWSELKQAGTIRFESTNKAKDGRIFPVEVQTNFHEFEGQEYNAAFIRDISDRKKSSEALLLTKHAVDHASTAIFWIGSTGRIVYANEQASTLTGYSSEELLFMKVEDLGRPHASGGWAKRWRELKAKGRQSAEEILRTKDGREVPVESTVAYLKYGEKEYCFAFVIDVAARKEAEEEMKRLAAAVHGAAESIIITDTAGTILYVNPWFEKMTGYEREEIIGSNPRILASGRHEKAFYKELWKTILSGRTWRGRFFNKKKDGSIFEERAVISPVQDASGEIVNYVAVKRDVTEERGLERQIRESQKMAAIGQLAHKVAHNFTNILVSILGNAQLAMAEVPPGSTVSRWLSEIIGSSNRVSMLTAELMAFAHPAPPILKTMNLNKAVTGVEEMLYRTMSDQADLCIKLSKKPLLVNIDPAQIEQVLMHLAINAFESVHNGDRIDITTSTAGLSGKQIARLNSTRGGGHSGRGKFAVLTVADTGCGVTEEMVSHIFEPFFTTKDKKAHSGLGLSTVYRIVDQHGGHVSVDSEVGNGSTIKVFLPLHQPE